MTGENDYTAAAAVSVGAGRCGRTPGCVLAPHLDRYQCEVSESDHALHRDMLAGIVEDVLTENMSLGTSGRWIADWATSPANLADEVARRVYPPGQEPTDA